MKKRILSLLLTLVLLISILPMLPFRASAANSYTMNVGDTLYLSLNTSDKEIISSFWYANCMCIDWLDDDLTSCQFRAIKSEPSHTCLIVCEYEYKYSKDSDNPFANYYQDREYFSIQINPLDLTVSLDPCGGSVSPSSITVTTGYTYGPLPTPVRGGYDFIGWFTEPEGGGFEIKCSSYVDHTSDHTLYAHWLKNDPSSFSDVPVGAFYEAPVLWALEKGITSGTSESEFSPNDSCLRAQVVTFLWRAAGKPAATSKVNPFVYVKPSDYYYDAVLWAVEKGITAGADATHFEPNGVCNRAQVVTFLYRAFEKPPVSDASNPFTDVPNHEWYAAPVLWAVKEGITNGLSETKFGPNEACNRAQVVTFLYRAYN